MLVRVLLVASIRIRPAPRRETIETPTTLVSGTVFRTTSTPEVERTLAPWLSQGHWGKTAPGTGNVSWKYVPCPTSGNVKFRLKEPSNANWNEVIVENHTHPIASVQVKAQTGNQVTGQIELMSGSQDAGGQFVCE